MGLRDKLKHQPVIGISIAVVMILLAAGLMARSLKNTGARVVKAAYYTVDDGQTWFAAGIDQSAPFEHDGKEAVKVYLFRCGKGKPFVAYLERFTPAGKKKADNMWAAARAKAKQTGGQPEIDTMAMSALVATATEVKKPGESQWYDVRTAPRSVMQLQCPDGGSLKDMYPVLP